MANITQNTVTELLYFGFKMQDSAEDLFKLSIVSATAK